MLCGLEGAWVRLIVCRASVTPLIPGDSNLEGPTGAFWPQYCNSNCLSSHNRPAASYSESECPEKVFISIQTWEALGKIGYSSSLSQLPYSESETLDFRKPGVLNIELFQNQNIQVNVESIRKSDKRQRTKHFIQDGKEANLDFHLLCNSLNFVKPQVEYRGYKPIMLFYQMQEIADDCFE